MRAQSWRRKGNEWKRTLVVGVLTCCSASHSLVADYGASCVQQEGKSRHVVDGHDPGRI